MKKTGLQPMSSAVRDELQRLASEVLCFYHSLLIPPSSLNRNSAVERRSQNGHIPRERNAWILFRSHLLTAIVKPLLSDKPVLHTQSAKSVLGASVWQGMSNELRTLWYQKASEEKEFHRRLYPDYKYHPKSKPRGRHPEPRPKQTESLPVEAATGTSLDGSLWLQWDSKGAPKSFDERPTTAHPDFYKLFSTQYYNYALPDSVLNFGSPAPMMVSWPSTCAIAPYRDLGPLPLPPHVQVPSLETLQEMSCNNYGLPSTVCPRLLSL